MKTQTRLFPILLTLALSACGKATETAAPAASAPQVNTRQAAPAAPAQTGHQPAAQASKPAAKSTAGKTGPVAVESGKTANPEPTVIKQTTEEALGDVASYGREKTRTQVSRARDRAQAAEDEMMQEIGKK